jgi:hypothetical protein
MNSEVTTAPATGSPDPAYGDCDWLRPCTDFSGSISLSDLICSGRAGAALFGRGGMKAPRSMRMPALQARVRERHVVLLWGRLTNATTPMGLADGKLAMLVFTPER